MKKLLSTILALSMMLCATVNVNATTDLTVPSTDKHDVVVNVKGESEVVYNVDVTWGNMEFTYDAANAKWNPDNHTYEDQTTNGWNQTSTITVTNHSNAPIAYAASFDANDEVLEKTVDHFKGTLTNTKGNLVTAVGTAETAAPNGTINLALSYVAINKTLATTPVTVGTITVTLSAN